MKRLLLAFLLLMLVVVGVRAQSNMATNADLAVLHGEWSIVSGVADGSPLPDFMVAEGKRICEGDTITVTIGPQLIMKAKISIDPTKNPKAIDFHIIDGPTKGQTQLGIYEVTGENLKSCFAAPGGARPTNFVSQAGSMLTYTTWKRDAAK